MNACISQALRIAVCAVLLAAVWIGAARAETLEMIFRGAPFDDRRAVEAVIGSENWIGVGRDYNLPIERALVLAGGQEDWRDATPRNPGRARELLAEMGAPDGLRGTVIIAYERRTLPLAGLAARALTLLGLEVDLRLMSRADSEAFGAAAVAARRASLLGLYLSDRVPEAARPPTRLRDPEFPQRPNLPTRFPDLVVPQLSASYDAGRSMITLRAIVANRGDAPALSYALTLYERGPDGRGRPIEREPRGLLRVRETAEIVFRLPNQALAPGDERVFYAVVSPGAGVQEPGGDNNASPDAELRRAALPDLVVEVFRGEARARQAELVIAIGNVGAEPAPPSRARVSARFPGIAPQDFDVPGLPARGGRYDRRLTLSLPPEAAGQDIALVLELDVQGRIEEVSEVNNGLTLVLRVPDPLRSDLQVLDLSAEPTPDGDIALRYAVSNGGAAEAPASVARIATGAPWNVTFDRPVPALGPRQSHGDGTMLRLPQDAAGRTVSITLTLDPADSIAEASEANNRTTTRVAIPAPRALQPDLVLQSVATRIENATLHINLVIDNEGEGPAPASTLRIKGLSAAVPDAAIPALAPLERHAMVLSFPLGDASGTVVLTAAVDPDNRIPEPNDRNNLRTASVTLPAADAWPWLALGLGALVVLAMLFPFVRTRPTRQREERPPRPHTPPPVVTLLPRRDGGRQQVTGTDGRPLIDFDFSLQARPDPGRQTLMMEESA